MLSTIISAVIGAAKVGGIALISTAATGGALLTTPQGIGVGLIALISGYVLKRADNKWVYAPIYYICRKIGVACTLGASRWAPKLWNRTIEPFIVDLLDNIFSAIKNGLFDGLHSDNK